MWAIQNPCATTGQELTIADAIVLIEELRGEIDACQALLNTPGIKLTKNIRSLVQRHSEKCRAITERINGVRVIIQAAEGE